VYSCSRVDINACLLVVNVNRIRDQGGFDEMKKREMMSDREALKSLHMDDKGSLLQHSNALPSVTENFKVRRQLRVHMSNHALLKVD